MANNGTNGNGTNTNGNGRNGRVAAAYRTTVYTAASAIVLSWAAWLTLGHIEIVRAVDRFNDIGLTHDFVADLKNLDARSLRSDVSTTLSVLNSHGVEFESLNREFQLLRGELLLYKHDVNARIDLSSSDRFRKSEWLAERERINTEIEALRRWVDAALPSGPRRPPGDNKPADANRR
jgi:hypothetical protein